MTLLEFGQQLGAGLLLYAPIKIFFDSRDSELFKREANKATTEKRKALLEEAAINVVNKWRPSYFWTTVIGTVLAGATTVIKCIVLAATLLQPLAKQ